MRFPLFFNVGVSTQVVQIIDTHDGERKRKRWEKERRAKEELREQILAAFEAELEPPEVVELARPGPEPIVERIDVDALFADLRLSQLVREAASAAGARKLRELERAAAERAAREREDEDIAILLLL